MQFIDILIFGALIHGAFKGVWNGLFVALASFVSLLIGIYLASKFSSIIESILIRQVDWSPKTIQVIAFAITFILVVIGINALAKVFTQIASFASLGWINKLAGGIFGLLKTALVVSVVLNLFDKININNAFLDAETKEKSICYEPMMEFSRMIYPSMEELIATTKLPE